MAPAFRTDFFNDGTGGREGGGREEGREGGGTCPKHTIRLTLPRCLPLPASHHPHLPLQSSAPRSQTPGMAGGWTRCGRRCWGSPGTAASLWSMLCAWCAVLWCPAAWSEQLNCSRSPVAALGVSLPPTAPQTHMGRAGRESGKPAEQSNYAQPTPHTVRHCLLGDEPLRVPPAGHAPALLLQQPLICCPALPSSCAAVGGGDDSPSGLEPHGQLLGAARNAGLDQPQARGRCVGVPCRRCF